MSYIATYRGHRVDLITPMPEQIDINDIAHALSLENRYCGHTRLGYSVAQHSVYLSRLVPAPLALEALLHDAAEAYIKDIPTPLKFILGSAYTDIERRIDRVIREKFNLPTQISPAIKEADLRLLATEKTVFRLDNNAQWPVLSGVCAYSPAEVDIQEMRPEFAEFCFLSAFKRLWQRAFNKH